MKKALMILGGIFLLLMLALAGFIAYAAVVGTKLDKSSKEYVDAELPKIITSWSADALVRDSSSELLESGPKDGISKLIGELSSDFGPLVKYNGSVGESGIHIFNGVKTVTAEYTASSTFSKGSAEFNIRLIQENQEWKILNFNVKKI